MQSQPGAPPTEFAEEIPSTFGRYQVIRPIGKGGMGVVYEARHIHLDRKVALKVLRRSLANNKAFLDRFYREIKALGQVLDNTHVILATDGGEEAGIPFLTMEYVEGQNLDQMLRARGGPLPADQACALICQAARGLDAIHQHQLVHRDLKPTNIMLTSDGVVKILDLGLVRLCEAEEDHAELTPAEGILGTLDYQAPEQALNPRAVEIRADIYSLGCTFHKLLAGHAPYGEQERTSKIDAHAAAPIPPLPEEVPAEVRAVAAKMMAKRPADRYATPLEVVAALTVLAGPGTSPPLLGQNAVCSPTTPTSVPVVTPAESVVATVTQYKGVLSTVAKIGAESAVPRRPRVLPVLAVFLMLGAAAITLGAIYFPRILDRSPARPDPLPARPVSLDQFNLLESHYLLDHEPVLALKPAKPLSSFGYSVKQRLLKVSCAANDHSLFHLGKVTAPSYELQVRIFQSSWNDGVGIYLGYRALAEPQPLFPNDKRLVLGEFQALKFQHVGAKGDSQFRLHRGIGKHYRQPNGEESVYFEDHASEWLPAIFDEQTLTLRVENHRLKSVYLEKLPELKKLVAPQHAQIFGPALHQGELGIWVCGSSAEFRDARFLLLKNQ